MIEVPLNKGYTAIIDEIDADLAKLQRGVQDGKNRTVFYAQRKICHKTTGMHVLILQRKLGRKLTANEITDHINSNGLDNRRSNLRAASISQNHCNRRKLESLQGRPTSSKYKGVRWEECRGKWRVDIRIEGKRVYLGRFKTEIDAANAYNRAAKAAFGEFARLNDTR